MRSRLLLILAVLAVTGCEGSPDTRPAATQEAVVNLGNDWSGSIVILPTGERVLLTYRYYHNGHGGQISTAAVLLPPAPAERTTP